MKKTQSLLVIRYKKRYKIILFRYKNKGFHKMSERNFPSIGLVLIINVILMYLEFTLFQTFGSRFETVEEETLLIFTLISLVVLALISVNFIITSIKSIKGTGFESINKVVSILTLIIIVIFMLQLFLNFMGYVGAFE